MWWPSVVLSVQCARDGRSQQLDEVTDVVEVLETDHRSLNRIATVAAGDAVGEGMELGDQLAVGDRVPRCAVRCDDAGVMHAAVAGGHREVGAEPFGER